MGDFTELLAAHRRGDASATDRLFAEIYADMRRLASRQLGGGHRGETLSATGLVHEAYLKLRDAGRLDANDRQHFMRLAAKVMRQIVIDYARERHALKRGSGASHVSLDDTRLAIDDQAAFLLQLEQALDTLDERLARVVEYRYFAGFTEAEVAELLDVTTRTVQRDWARAKLQLAELL